MKKLLTLILISFISLQFYAQDDTKGDKKEKKKVSDIDTTAVFSIDKTIKTLYTSISGEKQGDKENDTGETKLKRNWKQFHYLFKPEAKMIVSHLNDDFVYDTRYMSPKEYQKTTQKWMQENGFIEKEIHRRVEHFGNIVQVFSTYESYHSKENEKPFMRGINSIQMFYDGTRWWIVNIFWGQENDENPIPKKYLP
ncbi:hypothetical protein GSB9_01007 [Flavobacteriaceae bacterium GSB9]|nr:hypothetical protein GSB9_01007 [Flavobacteriaceae bacterium GSB9]